MLRTNLSASSPSSSEKTIRNQAVVNHTEDQASLIAPRTSGESPTSIEKLTSGVCQPTCRVTSRSFL